MHAATIQDILPLVQLPSRYLGNEVNRIKKSWNATDVHVALAFPDLYEIASSHFGIQILYNILNSQDSIMAERVFSPAVDMEQRLRETNVLLGSLESGIPIGTFDIVGFSLLYELNYTNMITMLDLAKIPFFTKDRGNHDPFIIGGGPCTCNPEPIADFFDALVVGDGERVILEMTSAWLDWKKNDGVDRRALLEKWSFIEGVYIPSFFTVRINADGFQELLPGKENYRRIKRAVIGDLNTAPLPLKPVLPFGRPVHDRLRMEIARGCTRGCRFCQAGMIYRPVRERHPDKIIAALFEALKNTGYEDVSLLSLSSGDYSCIAPLMKCIMDVGVNDRVAISLPSLRAGSLTPELMQLIRKVRKTGFTIAPEAGSQRLRDVINKNITEQDIVDTVENAFRLGWKVIKLYFMIGLPTETQADLEAIVALVDRIRSIAKGHGKRRINVSFATFVPKPHTPFQWEAQIDTGVATEKLTWLKHQFDGSDVHVKWQDPNVSMVEAVWSRGDRRLSGVLIEAWKAGCRFDGWSDFFNYDRWLSVFKKYDLEPLMFTQGRSDVETPLPWDHIDIGVTHGYLRKERQRGYQQQITPDCRNGACSGCGVCDFEAIKPISFPDEKDTFQRPIPAAKEENETHEKVFKYSLKFKKRGFARYLAHLEMVNVFIRSIRRADLPIKYSNGFHPMPKVSFYDTLPMGMESEGEVMRLSLTEDVAPEMIAARIAREIPDGFEIVECLPYTKPKMPETENSQHYRIQLKDGFFNQNELDSFINAAAVPIERKNKKGKTVVLDLRKAVVNAKIIDRTQAEITLRTLNRHTIRPSQVLRSVFHMKQKDILRATIIKQNNDV